MYQFARLLAMGALGVVLAAGLMAVVVPANAAATKSADQLWREIETFQYLHEMKLTRAQAMAAADLLEPVMQLVAQLEKRAEDPRVIAALEELRAAALAGQPITEEMYKKVTTARALASAEWTDEATPTMWAAAAEAASKIAASLDREQLLAVIQRSAKAQARTVISGAIGQAEADAESWQQWKTDTMDEIASTTELPEGAPAQISALLDRVHQLAPEAAEAQREALCAELLGLMVSPADDEELRRLAVETLADQIVDNRELQSCLREYGAAVGD